jgi:hypothetical protein
MSTGGSDSDPDALLRAAASAAASRYAWLDSTGSPLPTRYSVPSAACLTAVV